MKKQEKTPKKASKVDEPFFETKGKRRPPFSKKTSAEEKWVEPWETEEVSEEVHSTVIKLCDFPRGIIHRIKVPSDFIVEINEDWVLLKLYDGAQIRRQITHKV